VTLHSGFIGGMYSRVGPASSSVPGFVHPGPFPDAGPFREAILEAL
jgi:hypothetical protein